MGEGRLGNVRVGDLCTMVTSGGTPSRRQSDYFVDGHRGIPWLKTKELTDRVLCQAEEHISDAALRESSAKLLPGGTVLVAMYGATAGQLGLLGAPMACNQACCALVVDSSKADSRFLYYTLLSERSRLKSLANGAAQQNLSVGVVSRLAIAVPPLPEQRAIAEVLGALDDKIEANRRVVESILGLLTSTWRRSFADPPDEWPVEPIGATTVVVGGSTPRTAADEFWNGGITWATPKDLSRLSSPALMSTERTISDEGLRQISSGLLPPGTVLLSSRAPIGYLAIAEIPVAVNQGFIALPPGGPLPGLYLWQWLLHNLASVKERANGTTFMEVSKASFRPLPIAVPPVALIETWMELASPLYRRLVSAEVESRALTAIRDSLLPKLLSGEVRVRDVEDLVGEAV